ncbi:MAG: 30S ribosomal protein S16 [Ignavibacteria bacterium]
MVKIRLKRTGRKKRPFYRVVAADAKAPRDGRVIEEIGIYDPIQNPYEFRVKENRLIYWLKNGAQPTETVRALLKNEGYIYKLALMKRNLSPEAINAEMEEFFKRREERLKKLTEKRKKKSLRARRANKKEKEKAS